MKLTEADIVISAISSEYEISRDNRGNAYLSDDSKGNNRTHIVGGRICNTIFRKAAKKVSTQVSDEYIKYISEVIRENAETSDARIEVYGRFFRKNDIVTIDVCDKDVNRIVLEDGQVRIQSTGELTNFCQAQYSLPYVLPDKTPIIDLIADYLNISKADQLVLICFITFVICHPKTAEVSTPILCLIGGQGTGKSSLCRLFRQLIDPSEIGIQKLPRNSEQLALMAQNANILFFDNVRNLSPDISDSLCATSTGGKLSSRKLYTNGEEYLLSFKAAVVINGIYPFINQPDLADRCITINPTEIPPSKRRTEADINESFEKDATQIMAGLLKLSALAIQKFAEAQVKSPSRMLDFCRWIAAVELAFIEITTEEYKSVKVGDIQQFYTENQERLTLDNLLENELASAIFDLANSNKIPFKGTPAQLLAQLNSDRSNTYMSAHQWPNNPIALSKRLVPLLPALRKHDIEIALTRGKERRINISVTDKHPNYPY